MKSGDQVRLIAGEIELLGLDFASTQESEAAKHDVIAAKKEMV